SRPDLILMDLAMPVLDGLAAARKIRDLAPNPNIPMVAISAFSTSGFFQAAHHAGFVGYVTKPVDFERMDELIETRVGGRLRAPAGASLAFRQRVARSNQFVFRHHCPLTTAR